MNLEELSKVTKLDVDSIKKQLKPFRIDAAKVAWKSLEVPAKQTITVSQKDKMFADRIVNLRPKSLDDVREWVGVPQRVFNTKGPLGPRGSKIQHGSMAKEIFTPKQLESIPKNAKLIDLDIPERALFMGAAKNLVFNDVSKVELAKPLYQAALEFILEREFPIFFLLDITVHPGATLNIDPSVATVFAYRIKIWQGGRIVTPRHSFVSFHCRSIEGGITS